MGKKKSVVLMTIITIVILVLCAIVAFPSITLPGTEGINKWNPAIMQYDLGEEFDGGHYAYYYPNGVITETEYESDEENQASYTKVGGLYLSNDPEDGVLEDGKVTEGFKNAFNKTVKVITDRFAARAMKTGSTYRVSVVDSYAIRVELSAADNLQSNSQNGINQTSYGQAINQFAKFGEVTFEAGADANTTELVEQMKGEDVTASDIIRNVSVGTRYETAFLHITFKSLGKEMLQSFKDSDNTSLLLKIGDETILQITEDVINTKNEVEYGIDVEDNKLFADTLCVLINSAIEEGNVYINEEKAEMPLNLRAPTSSEIATYASVNGDVLVWVYAAVLVALAAVCVLSIVKMGGFGVAGLYASLSYFVITTICFGFISGGIFVVDYGTILTFLVGLMLVNAIQAHIYGAVKNEVAQGKTVQSAVKNGYKKTLFTVVDIYAVLVLGAIALLLGVASLNTFACQALICVIAGAFCNLLWGRVINYTLLSASKDKYKYFRFVREEDEDDE